jgi:hypothetical protein
MPKEREKLLFHFTSYGVGWESKLKDIKTEIEDIQIKQSVSNKTSHGYLSKYLT